MNHDQPLCVRIAVPATSANLGPGFDTLALALQLQNEVEITETGRDGVTIDAGPAAPPELLDPARNAVTTAFAHASEVVGARADGIHVRCHNRIPMRRGLGSSAAARLAGVIAANAIHDCGWDENVVISRVAELEGHPDNAAAALRGGLVISPAGAASVSLEVPEELVAVLLVPDLELTTAAARAVVPTEYSRADAVYNAGRCALLVRAVAVRDWDSLREAMDDRWHQPQRTALLPFLPDVLAAALGAGGRGAALSGAGPSVIALTDREPETVARAMMAAARSHGLRGKTMVSGIRNWGARVDVTTA